MSKPNISVPPSLKHLIRLTTNHGLWQHCAGSVPDPRYGYSLDDNARALLVVWQYARIFKDDSVLVLTEKYFSYIKKAQLPSGLFHNFADANGQFIDKVGSQSVLGRTIWALGHVVSRPEINKNLANEAKLILNKAPLNLVSLRHSRPQAFALLGFCELNNRQLVSRFADRLTDKFDRKKSDDWFWFDDELTHDNAIFPFSLFRAYSITGNQKYLNYAEESLHFLMRKSVVDNRPAPIGQSGWHKRGGDRAIYDQQTIDASDMVLASVLAYKITHKSSYKDAVNFWWSWFEGNNLQHKKMIDPVSGGCYDGITPTGVNKNQGAESIVCYLLAYLSMAEMGMEK